MRYLKISFAGAGRVAGALCREFFQKGHSIELIVTPGKDHGPKLADSCGASWSDEPVFPDSTDIVIVSVPDHALPDLLGRIKCGRNCVVAHTAGSFGLELFNKRISRPGVFYPLQTFSAERRIDFTGVPVFIEASGKDTEALLADLAGSVGSTVRIADTASRRLLHIAAVFVNNFTNHMLESGMEIAGMSGFDFKVLEPLIKETVNKAIDIGPENAQTGPAVRYDLNTMEKHMDLLSFSPELKKLYGEISRSIMDHYKQMSRNE